MEQTPNIHINEEKFKHLKEGVLPIRVCIEAYKNMYDDNIYKKTRELKNNSQDIKWNSTADDYKKNNILTGKYDNYSISEINEKNKFSTGYLNCTGIVLVGIDKETGENISILTHQTSGEDMKDKTFINDISEQIKEFVSRCEKETIDALIFGGNKENLKEYEEAVKILDKISSPLLGFSPDVATGPKIDRAHLDTQAFFNTKKRQLHIFMPEQENTDIYEDFNSSNVEEKYIK